MKEEVSAGVLIFRDTRDCRQYLLLRNRADDWEFPKGGVEGAEELQQTALREAKEETGIDNIRLIDGFREDYDYIFRGQGGEKIHKTVHLFIGKAYDHDVELSHEHDDLQWRDYEEARNTITHEGPRQILDEAHEFLENKAALS